MNLLEGCPRLAMRTTRLAVSIFHMKEPKIGFEKTCSYWTYTMPSISNCRLESGACYKRGHSHRVLIINTCHGLTVWKRYPTCASCVSVKFHNSFPTASQWRGLPVWSCQEPNSRNVRLVAWWFHHGIQQSCRQPRKDARLLEHGRFHTPATNHQRPGCLGWQYLWSFCRCLDSDSPVERSLFHGKSPIGEFPVVTFFLPEGNLKDRNQIHFVEWFLMLSSGKDPRCLQGERLGL